MTSYISENLEFSEEEQASAIKIDNIITRIIQKIEDENNVPCFNTRFDEFSKEELERIRDFIQVVWSGDRCWINSNLENDEIN